MVFFTAAISATLNDNRRPGRESKSVTLRRSRTAPRPQIVRGYVVPVPSTAASSFLYAIAKDGDLVVHEADKLATLRRLGSSIVLALMTDEPAQGMFEIVERDAGTRGEGEHGFGLGGGSKLQHRFGQRGIRHGWSSGFG